MTTTHGWVAYSNGCRCDECREAWRVYHADYVARRRTGRDSMTDRAEQGRRAANLRWGKR